MQWKDIFGLVLGLSLLFLIWAVTYMAFVIAFKGSRILRDLRALVKANILSLTMNKSVQKETKAAAEEVKQVANATAVAVNATAEAVKELRDNKAGDSGILNQ